MRRLLALLGLSLLLSSPRAAAQDDPPPASPPQQKLMRYVVVKGDSCQGLAQRIYGDARRIDLLHQFNDLGPTPHHLKEGQVLFFPPPNLAPPLSGPDAKVSHVRNNVKVFNPGQKQGQHNDPLSRGHKVSTSSDSSAEVSFRDETRLQLGENTLVVIFGDSNKKASQSSTASDTQLMSGQLRAHLGALAGGDPITVKTESGDVGLGTGEAQIHVDTKKTTRLTVYKGQSTITSKNQTVKVAAGYGSRATPDAAPTAPKPLPPEPAWVSTPPPSFLTAGRRVSFALEYGPGKDRTGKGGAAAQWHVQIARDSSFNGLVVNAKVPASTTKIEAKNLGPGHYYARVSAIDDEQFEGPFGPTSRVTVTLARLVRDEAQKSTSAQVIPPDVFCGLDSAPLRPVSAALRKSKGQFKKLRCGPSSDAKLASEMAIPAPYAAPFALRSRIEKADPDKREAHLVFSLSDGKGQPLTGSSVELSPTGASLGVVEEAENDGEYHATVWWDEGTTSFSFKAVVDGTSELLSDTLELPSPAPPPPAATEPTPPPPPPPVPPKRGCGCQTPGSPAPSSTLPLALALASLLAARRRR